jgi:integrase
MRAKLTKSLLDKTRATCKPGQRIDMLDTESRGLTARVTAQGVTFTLTYRDAAGDLVRHKLGKDIDVAVARRLATVTKGEIAGGADPAREKRLAKLKAQASKANSVGEVVKEFLTDYVRGRKNLRSADEIERVFNVYVLPRWKDIPTAEITRVDVKNLIARVATENGEVMADRVLAWVRKCFNHHAANSNDFVTPIVRGMNRTSTAERARKRVLTPDEIKAIWDACPKLDTPAFGELVRFLLLTGQRRDEACEMRRGEVVGSEWTIPASRYKTKRDHVVPLSDDAKAILDALPVHLIDGQESPLVFTVTGKAPLSNFARHKRQLDKLSGVGGDEGTPGHWTLHDLRRTAKTLMTGNGVPHFNADRVLGHVIPGVGGTYDRHTYQAEKTAALKTLAATIRGILNPAPDNIIRMEPRATA